MSFDADCAMVWLTWSRQCGGPLIGMAFDDSLSSARGIYLVVIEMHIRPKKKQIKDPILDQCGYGPFPHNSKNV